MQEAQDKRNVISSFFITLLIGLAFKEMILVHKDAIQTSTFTPGSLLLVGTFFLISVRFFIGNRLHLISEQFLELPGWLWLYDIMIIILQSMIIILLGGLTSIDLNLEASFGFLEIMILLYSIDVFWIITQELISAASKTKRKVVYWWWAGINFVLSAIVIILSYYIKDLYSTIGLQLLFGLNLLAFIFDVFLLDYFGVITLSKK